MFAPWAASSGDGLGWLECFSPHKTYSCRPAASLFCTNWISATRCLISQPRACARCLSDLQFYLLYLCFQQFIRLTDNRM